MFGFFGGLVRCAKGKHERSERQILKQGDDYVSRCRYCRAPMRRLAKRSWIVDRTIAR